MSKNAKKSGDIGDIFQQLVSEMDALYGKYARVNKMTARQKFADVTNLVGYHKKRVLLTNREDPFVLMAPVEDLRKLDLLDAAGVNSEELLREILEDYRNNTSLRRKYA
jgi:hypothetical protein